MQSGISVSSELRNAFAAFTADPSQFCLPVTIAAEALAPLPPLGFVAPNTTTGTDGRESVDEFYASLPQLRSNTSPAVLQPQTPIYLLLRHAPTATAGLTALTYIPSNAGVRAKTLFAATRASLVRELGSEKFAATVFATDEDEVVGEAAWRERELAAAGDSYDQLDSSSPSGIGAARTAREELMGDQERELERVRRAVEEARVSSISRDIGIGGTFKRQQGAAGAGAGAGASMAVAMAMDDQARDALRGLQQGCLVQLAIDIATETLQLAASRSEVHPASVATHISESSPRYTFYHYPESDVAIFIYTCPASSSIKERMLYASTRMAALQLADGEGIKVSKKIEASTRDEITESRLHEEVHPPQDEAPKRGFARPKRPGR